MQKKSIALFTITMLVLLTTANARTKVTAKGGYTLYYYENLDEFYNYWIEAAESYPLVYIEVIRNESGAKSGTLSSLLYDGTLTFGEQSEYWQLGATFLNNKRKDMTTGRYFYLPDQLEQAIRYWDTLRKNM